jgi:two-component system sensor histidine kinase DevS
VEESDVVLLDFRALLEAAPDGIAVVDERGRILVVNEQLSYLFGYGSAELIGAQVEALVPPRLRGGHEGHRHGYGANPATRPMGMGLELLGLRKDGTEFPLEISLSPVRSGRQTFTIAIVRDSTERKRLQSEEQALRTFLDTEQERHRIGMDLHDGIMQDIYATTLGLELVHEDIDANPVGAKGGVGRAIDQLHDVIRDIRSYIFDLRPRQFTGDLREALLDLGREFQENSSIQTEVFVPASLPSLDYAIGVAYYVITHEALSNTRKHAQARSVTITLRVEDARLNLEVRDDGLGFDTSLEFPERHRGLRNMASRAGVVGAEFDVDSAPGEGTAIQVELRLN